MINFKTAKIKLVIIAIILASNYNINAQLHLKPFYTILKETSGRQFALSGGGLAVEYEHKSGFNFGLSFASFPKTKKAGKVISSPATFSNNLSALHLYGTYKFTLKNSKIAPFIGLSFGANFSKQAVFLTDYLGYPINRTNKTKTFIVTPKIEFQYNVSKKVNIFVNSQYTINLSNIENFEIGYNITTNETIYLNTITKYLSFQLGVGFLVFDKTTKKTKQKN